MTLDTAALPSATPASAGQQQTDPNVVDGATREVPAGEGGDADGVDKGDAGEADKAKPEKTPEERERQRMQRAIDRRTRQAAEAKAERDHYRGELERLTAGRAGKNNSESADDGEPVSLTRAELNELVNREAKRIAPTLSEQASEAQRRHGVVEGLAKTWGAQKFDEMSSDLDDAFGGLVDRSGRPRPAIDAVFEADDPKAVIEFLTDPDNLDEAERISRLSAAAAGKAIAKLEATLKTAPAKDKPRPSNVPAPLESARGQGGGSSTAPNPSDTKAWIRWRNEQERKGL